MRRIIICYASYGGGHFSAAKNIKEYIEQNYTDCDVFLFDSMKYINKAIDKICGSTYNTITKSVPWFWGKVYYHTQSPIFEKILSLSNKLLAYKLNKLLNELNPEVIISTHFFVGHMCATLKKHGKIDAKLVNVITDYGDDPYNEWIAEHEYLDYIFVAHDEMKTNLVQKGVDEQKIYATGIPISSKFLIHYNKNKILESLNFTDDKKTILFFAGGEFGLAKNKITELLKNLAIYFENTQIIAIAGKNETIKQHFEEISNEYNADNRIRVFDFTDRVAEFMYVSDLVITKPGGLTSTESIVSKLPLLIINPIPGQETENAEFLEERGVGILLQKNDDIDLALDGLLNNQEELDLMKRNCEKIAKPNSTKDICEILLNNKIGH